MRGNLTRRILAIVISFCMIIGLEGISFAVHTSDSECTIEMPLRVLEIQPGTRYELNKSMFSGISSNVELRQMCMNEFISSIEEVNGNYDIVYIGNNSYQVNFGNVHYNMSGVYVKNENGSSKYVNKENVEYRTKGYYPRKLPQGGQNHSHSTEAYSANDITIKRAKVIGSFIESGQLTIIDEEIFNNNELKLYKGLHSYSGTYNFIETNNVSNINMKDKYEECKKRPCLELVEKPSNYTQDRQMTENKMLSFTINACNRNGSNPMKIRLFVDDDGDGLFKQYEMVHESNAIYDVEGYAINYEVQKVIGLQPWAIEVEDLSTGSKSRTVGYTGLLDEELVVRVLQVYPKKNTLDIKNALNYDDNYYDDTNGTLLHRAGEYNIQVEKMKMSDFNNNAPDLNGNYDMIIIGFADMYGGEDLTNDVAVQKVKNFIATGQSVLFTHDMFNYYVKKNSGWGVNLTREFRDMVGQNIYNNDKNNSSIKVTAENRDEYLTDHGSYGFTNMTLDRANNGGRFSIVKSTNKMNEGFLTLYPFILPNNLSVKNTHYQYFQLDLEDEDVVPWFTLDGNGYNKFDGRNNYYTYTKGTITFSGTGHMRPDGTPEHKFFVNTMLKAIKGANHAPKLEVLEVKDDDKISKETENLKFKIKATDLDLGDEKILGSIYIDKNGDGNFSSDEIVVNYNEDSGNHALKSGVIEDVNIDISDLPNELEELRIKVIAHDDQGAEDSTVVNMKRVNMAIIEVVSSTSACLVGDNTNIDFQVLPRKTDKDTVFRNIRLSVSCDDGVSLSSGGSWYTESGKVKTAISDYVGSDSDKVWTCENRQLPVSVNSSGTHRINYTLTYQCNGETQTVEGTAVIDSKVGKINVEVVDKKGRAIKDTDVYLYKKIIPDGEMLNYPKSGDTRDGVTGKTGLYTKSNLDSGSYTVVIEQPSGYEIFKDKGKRVNLSYSNNQEKLRFELSGDCISDVKVTSVDGDNQVKVTPQGKFIAKVSFRVTREMSYNSMQLSSNLDNFNIKVLELTNVDYEQISQENNGTKVICNKTLQPGIYEYTLLVDAKNATLNVGDIKELKLDNMKIREPHFEEDELDEYIYNKILELLVVEKPKIE